MSEESPIAELTRRLREVGVIDRMAETSIIENHAYLVSVGDLPELVRGKLHQKLVPAPDETGTNVAGISARQNVDLVPESDGSFGVFNGTLSVDRSNEATDDRPTVEVPTLTEEDLEAIDEVAVAEDETSTTVPKKRGKNK